MWTPWFKDWNRGVSVSICCLHSCQKRPLYPQLYPWGTFFIMSSFHYCGHLNWYKMWSCDKWITNRPTSHHKDYQRLSEEVQLYLRRGCGGGLQWSLQSWEGSLSTVSLCQRCLLLFGPGRISSLQLTSYSHRNYPCTHAPGEKWGEGHREEM